MAPERRSGCSLCCCLFLLFQGKPLNVRDATHKQMMANEEMKNLLDIMGLKPNVVYDEKNIKTLRYGHLMIMADQDHDGSHIKGLVVNFIHRKFTKVFSTNHGA